MSPGFDKYRALAKAEGDQTTYTDDDLLRLWAAMEHLFAKATTINCPQIFAATQVSLSSQPSLAALDSQDTRPSKEINE